MKWVKYLLTLLASLILGSVLILAGMVLLLQESHYKRLLGWGAEAFLDSQLLIKGPFKLDISRNLSLSSGDILLHANDDSYRLAIGKLNANFRLGSYLQTGSFWFNHLELEDIDLEVIESSEDNDGFNFKDLEIPLVIISKAQFNNLQISYQELLPGTLHKFSLDELNLEGLGGEKPVSLSAKGSLKGKPFELEGRSDSVAQLLKHQDPLTVQMTLSSELINIKIQGTIDEPFEGGGLDLQIQTDIPQLKNIIEIFWDEIPVFGDFQSSFALRGDYKALRLESIDLHLQREQEVDLKISGSIADLLSGKGLDLQVNGTSNNPEVLSWLLFEKYDRMQTLQVSGKLQGDVEKLSLHDLNAVVETVDDMKLQVSGNADVNLAAQLSDPSKYRIAMDMDFQSNDIAQLAEKFDYTLPELGPMHLRGKLVTQDSELLLQGARLTVGTDEQSILHANGMVAAQLSDPSKYRIAMDMDFQSNEIAQLAEKFDYTLPELGPMHITGWLESKESELHLNDAIIVVGADNQPNIRANGRVVTKLEKDASSININYDVAVSPLIAAFSDLQPSNLGRLQGDAVIANLDGDWGIENFTVASTNTGLYQLQMSGSYDDLETYDKALITTSLSIDSPIKLGEALGLNLSGLASYDLKGELSIKKGHLYYVGKTSLGNTNSTAKLNGYLKDGKPVFGGNFDIPILYLTDLGFGASKLDVPKAPVETPISPYVFSREPLNLDFLKEFDFDFVVSVDKVESDMLRLSSVKSHLKLNNGHLAGPVSLVFEDGKTDINLDIKVLAVPEYRFSIISDDLILGPLMAQVTEDIPIEGYSNIYLELHTRGNTPHELASNLSGDVDLGLENARIPQKYVDILFVDAFGWALHSTTRKSHANLNCVLMTFGINKGSVKSETVIMDGPRLSIAGQIDMDLGKETLDIVLLPKKKKRMFAKTTPVKVQGPMRDPKVTAIPARAAAEIGAMTLFSGVFVPLRLSEKIWQIMSDGDVPGVGCANVEKLSETSN